MELDDCAFPLLAGVVQTDDPKVAFKDADIALLVGARPRGPGMERKDLLEANGAIFTAQGRALNEVASRDVKVLVVGNPANTNAYIAMKNAPDLNPANFTAMMRLDHNRALTQLAQKTGNVVTDVKKMIIWATTPARSTRTSSTPRSRARTLPSWSMTRSGSKPNSSRPYNSAAPPLSRRVACRRPHRPPTPPSTYP